MAAAHECSICGAAALDDPTSAPCGHSFHRACLRALLAERAALHEVATCPACRGPIEQDQARVEVNRGLADVLAALAAATDAATAAAASMPAALPTALACGSTAGALAGAGAMPPAPPHGLGAPPPAAASLAEQLWHACNDARAADALRLIDEGAGMEYSDADGITPIMLACHLEPLGNVAARLVQAGAELDRVNSAGWSALHWACHDGKLSIARLLLDGGAQLDVLVPGIGCTALLLACINAHKDVAKLLVKRGARLDIADIGGQTVIMYVCERGFASLARRMAVRMDAAALNAISKQGMTALDYALERGERLAAAAAAIRAQGGCTAAELQGAHR
jgi:hypothetical protein